jgi:hypothetical protein
VPRPARDDARWQRVVQLAGRLAAVDDRFAAWAQAVGVPCGPLDALEKQAHIHELDAVVAHLYGVTERQLLHLSDLPRGWDYWVRLSGLRKLSSFGNLDTAARSQNGSGESVGIKPFRNCETRTSRAFSRRILSS